MKLSVVIPIYNVQEYVKECLETVINQKFIDMEILIINDGSTDESINIIEKIQDSRIKIIHQKNKGLSGARNKGISIANGEYITFLDSDDILLGNNVYEEMIKILEKDKSSMIIGEALYYYNNGETSKFTDLANIFREKSSISGSEFLIEAIREGKYHAPVCFNIYRTEVLKKNDLQFKEGIFHEDEEFTPKIIMASDKVSYYKKSFYGYRQREGSITKKVTSKNGKDIVWIALSYENILDEIKEECLKKELGNYFSLLILNSLYKYKDIKVTDEMIKFMGRYAQKKNAKLRVEIIKKNIWLYRYFEKIYRKVRGVEK